MRIINAMKYLLIFALSTTTCLAQRPALTVNERLLLQEKETGEIETHLTDADSRVVRYGEAMTSYEGQTDERLEKLERDEQMFTKISGWLLAGIVAPSFVGMLIGWMNGRRLQNAAGKFETASVQASSTHRLVNSNMEQFKEFMKEQLALVRQELKEERDKP